MVPLARALAARGMRAWLLDRPGFGYSDKPRRVLAVPEQAALIAEWLAVIGCRLARALGNSFGCQVAAAVAAGHRGAVRRLVLINPTVAPEVRQRLSWLRVLPGPAGSCGPSGRGRARLLARGRGALGDDPAAAHPQPR